MHPRIGRGVSCGSACVLQFAAFCTHIGLKMDAASIERHPFGVNKGRASFLVRWVSTMTQGVRPPSYFVSLLAVESASIHPLGRLQD